MTNGSRDASAETETIGLDLSDQSGLYVVIDGTGAVVSEGKVVLTSAGIERTFGRRQACRIALEVGTHRPG